MLCSFEGDTSACSPGDSATKREIKYSSLGGSFVPLFLEEEVLEVLDMKLLADSCR